MSAVCSDRADPLAVTTAATPAVAPVRIALLGTGTVGTAVLQRLLQWRGTPYGDGLALAYVANSRVAAQVDASAIQPGGVHAFATTFQAGVDDELARHAGGVRGLDIAASPFAHALPEAGTPRLQRSALGHVAPALGAQGVRIIIDATASDSVAACHADWLGRGIHVVTACKLGAGTSLRRWQAIRAACVHGRTHYGDSATVGAGLPLLRSLRELQVGGDRIHAIAGVLSGSLAWLFHHYDGLRPFSSLVREARGAGCTEPDPREDLSGEDVRRKLLILARAAGVALDSDAVAVESLVPRALTMLDPAQVDAALPQLDAPMRVRYVVACEHGQRLRFIARLQCRGATGASARVGLESLAADDPLAGGVGTDNQVAIWSDRYPRQPLLIQGPGAGAEVTAAALLDDVLRIAARRQER